ncbi:pullulanase [Alkalicoccus urumqiensis]|uniref:pullulanase n=2 Tax=Alkalicoccus urumqiensis TaxID=1548213 RepID=A0A2P6MHX9_ALKUR|nr:pullulanase [Alkalicoccus urumqiensis]
MMMTGVMGLSVLTPFASATAQEQNDDAQVSTQAEEIADGDLRIHFDSGETPKEEVGIWHWAGVDGEPGGEWPGETRYEEGNDTDFGLYFDVTVEEGAEALQFNFNNEAGDAITGDLQVDMLSDDVDEVWIDEDENVYYYEPETLADDTLRVHFAKDDEQYEPWGFWGWGDVAQPAEDWPMDSIPFTDEQTGPYGAYIDVDLAENAESIGFLLNQRVDEDGAAQSGDMSFADFDTHQQIFLQHEDDTVYTNPYYVAEDAEEELDYKEGEEDISVAGSVSNEFHHDQNAVLELDVTNNSELDIVEMSADTSALGGNENLEIDPYLGAVTISATHDTAPGTYDIPVQVVDETGGVYMGSAEAVVTENTNDDIDWDEESIYFMLTDRFADGDASNNDPYGLNYDELAADNPRGAYQGGDFKGVTDNLDYLDELGISTIWITPIVENVAHDVEAMAPENDPYFGYHGYWAADFETLNPHLGTLEEFHTLIDEAAARDMKIMVDVVLNHPGYGVKAEEQLSEEIAPPGYPDQEIVDRFDGMIRESSGAGDLKMELSGLPDFETERWDVSEQLVDWQTSWLDKSTTDNGNAISSYRVDTVKHVDDATWQHFKNELTKKDPDFKLIGESWGAASGNDMGYLNTGTMDSLLDFGFKNIASTFADGNVESAESQLQERNDFIESNAQLGQFLGSHDEPGFKHNHGEEALLLGASLQMTAKGQPVIYYGEELGQTGANNWPQYDNRYDLDWDGVEGNDTLAHYDKLLEFRNANRELFARGERTQLAGSDEDGTLAFARTYNGDAAAVALNTTGSAADVTLSVDGDAVVTDHYSGDTFTAADGSVTVPVPAAADGGTALLSIENGTFTGADMDENTDVSDIPENHLRVHYAAEEGQNIENLGVWYWDGAAVPAEENASWPGEERFSTDNTTSFGPYYDIELAENAESLSMLVNNTGGDNITGDVNIEIISQEMNEIWLKPDGTYSLAEPAEGLADNEIRIHYDREDDSYDNWSAWIFDDVASPSAEWPNGQAFDGTGRYGAYVDVELADDAQKVGFLFVNTDEEQTDDMTIDNVEGGQQYFVQDSEDRVYDNPYYTTTDGLQNAEVLSEETIELRFSGTDSLDGDTLAESLQVTDKDGEAVTVDGASIDDERTVTIQGNFDLERAPFFIEFNGRTAEANAGWRLKDELYSYDGDLGVSVHEDGAATLKLWSPSADNVRIKLYDKDDQDNVITDDVSMELGERGVWEVTLDEGNTGVSDLRGYYYHYVIERDGETVEALDPYAASMATWNSEEAESDEVGKAAIVDPAEIGPELDYADIDGFETREDAIIYEMHVRDFTSDPSIADELESRFGTFAAFAEKLDYIEEMGVTHVQLLPVMSYYFADEENVERLMDYDSNDNNYNWGYDPHSYFSLSGMYSEDPDDAAKRIEEFKNLIQEIHDRDMGVVLDVVYNHTARVNIFEDLEPNYYHFMDADGTPRVSFGGGRLGTTHEMARKVLIDSIMHWVEEYKVDGFRFDMMGDHDAESIQIAYDTAKEANPNIVMIGEGWVTYAGDENYPDVQPADQQWMQDTESVGSFSDDFRNELKSGFGSEGEPRFITGGARDVERIYNNLTAEPGNFTASDPGDVVPYIAAHDNLTLHDVIAQSIQKDPKDHEEEIHQRIRLGNAMVLTAQGTAFIHAGQEYGRTKQFRDDDYITTVDEADAPYKSTYLTDENGDPFEYPYFIHDSYDSTDAINKFDWEKATNDDAYPVSALTRDMTQGFIELRRSTDAFTQETMADVDENVSMIDAPEIGEQDLVVAYTAEDPDTGEQYHVFVNADSSERTLTLREDLTDGDILADSDEAGAQPVSDVSGVELDADSITVDALTAVVVKTGGSTDGGDAPAFSDVSESDWFYEAVTALAGMGVVEGNGDGTFQPASHIRRGDMAVMISRALDLEASEDVPFRDVAGDAYYVDGIAAAYEAGIVNGVSPRAFAAQRPVKREELAAMLVRAYEYEHGEITAGASSFADADALSDWVREEIGKAQEAGLVNGRGNNRFHPKQPATRAEAAQMLYHLLDR